MLGNGNNDTLYSGDGNGEISGGAGHAVLTGGADVFCYSPYEDDRNDVITDFTDGEDRIDLGLFDGLSYSDLTLT